MVSMEDMRDKIAEIAPEYGISKALLFGSYAEDTATEESDLDFLMEFAPRLNDLFDLFAVEIALEEALGVDVDIIPLPLPEGHSLVVAEVLTVYESAIGRAGRRPGIRHHPKPIGTAQGTSAIHIN